MSERALKVTLADRSVSVEFTRNDDIQRAYDAAHAALPRLWAQRGRLEWYFLPIDHEYGDPLERGFLCCKWGERW